MVLITEIGDLKIGPIVPIMRHTGCSINEARTIVKMVDAGFATLLEVADPEGFSRDLQEKRCTVFF